ncbi:MAG: LytTR family transcriptional regulator DNA-binding domain-containing protein [Oscillospiraceae bacterium]
MHIKEVIKNIKGSQRLCFACAKNDMQTLFENVKKHHANLGVVRAEEPLNERLTAEEYLSFFADLWQCKNKMAHTAQALGITDFFEVNIARLTEGQKKRVALAREGMHEVKTYYFEEPLAALNQQERSLVLEWMDTLPEEAGIITASTANEDVSLLPGEEWQLNMGQARQIQRENAPVAPLVVDKIPARREDSVFLFNPGDIEYAESADGKTELTVKGEKYQCASSLEELEIRLVGYGFYRCHRSYLVNMQKVYEIVHYTRNSYTIRLENSSQEIPLSKGRIEEMKQLYRF